MSTYRRLRVIVLAVGLAGAFACTGEKDNLVPVMDLSEGDWVSISYRGQQRMAQKRGDDLIIEGDIVVGPADLPSIRRDDLGDVERVSSPLARRPGFNFKWQGPVAYSLINVAAVDRAAVVNGIALWTSTVPGLTFTQLAGACTGDCINFVTSTVNNSPAGRQGGTQTINLQANPPPGVVAHEVGHSLGFWHEQSRSDGGPFIQINWAQVTGCVNGATSAANCGPMVCQAGPGTPAQNAVNNGCCSLAQFNANQCFQDFNFDVADASPQALIGLYDYGSIMHYGTLAFAKGALPTMTTLQPVPPGVVVGQINGPSQRDLESMRVLYPQMAVSRSLFRDTGVSPLAVLDGRTEDINVQGNCTLGGASIPTIAINTASLTEGSSTLNCVIFSPLWALNYQYPNTTNTTWPASGIESFAGSATLTVMNPGLIGVFNMVR